MTHSQILEDDTPADLKADILTLVQVVVRQADEIARLKNVLQENSARQRQGNDQTARRH